MCIRDRRKYFIESAAVTCQISNVWWWAANGDIDPEAYTTSGYGWGALTLPNPDVYKRQLMPSLYCEAEFCIKCLNTVIYILFIGYSVLM